MSEAPSPALPARYDVFAVTQGGITSERIGTADSHGDALRMILGALKCGASYAFQREVKPAADTVPKLPASPPELEG